MPVDLNALPEKLALPQPPGLGRWCLIILLCPLLTSILLFLLWPGDSGRMSLWFWCCALVLPLMGGLVLYALRLLAYERRCDYLESWNLNHEEHQQGLIQKGQRAIALLATSYCSAAGNSQIAQALRLGSKPLQPIYIESQELTLRLSQLKPPARHYTKEEYTQRLAAYFHQVMRGLEPDFQRYVPDTPLCVRIRHNQVLDDDEVLSLWRSCLGDEQILDQVVFATQDDGLLWLDTWLDKPASGRFLLSLELNLFLSPVAEQAESVSAVLLAQADTETDQRFEPLAWLHRPVRLTVQAGGWENALFWGQIPTQSPEYFTWHLQLPSDFLGDLNIAMAAAGHPPDIAKCQQLDDSLGLPGCAVGNMALIIASEHAGAEHQAQLIILQDTSPQACVVRPA